jgi:hypothetical protein
MKNCTDCKHAQWRRTKAGSLHPSGDGRCGYPYKLPPLPAAMKWRTYMGPVEPVNFPINRRVDLPDHCVYWSRT